MAEQQLQRTVRAWVEGWVVSRGAADPSPEPWGCTVDVGQPKQVSRHVFSHADEPTVRKVADGVTVPGVWLKVFEEPEVVARWLGPGWQLDEPGFLMSVPLRQTSGSTMPDGYRLRTWERGGVIRAVVTTTEGAFAARGQMAPTGATAVADQVETDPAHRRKGLGAVVMRALTDAVWERGARTGILGGTVAGRGLYESLGWRVEAPLTSAVREAVLEA